MASMPKALRWLWVTVILSSAPSRGEEAKIPRFVVRPQFGVALPEFRAVRENLHSLVASNGAVSTVTDEVGMGLAFALEFGYMLQPEVGDDCRMGLSLKGGLVTAEVKASGSGGGKVQETDTLKNSLILVLPQVWVEGGRNKGFHYRTSFGMGLGLASADYSAEASGSTSQFTVSGNGVIFDLAGEWGYAVQKDVRIYLQTGFLIAGIKKMSLSAPWDADGDGQADVEAGAVYMDTHDKPLRFNFSGPRAQLGFAVGF
jgi:hypothetical protein